MNFWLFTTLLTCSLYLALAAPKSKGKAHLALEQAMLHKLHKPWYKPDKPPQQPRKGERPCAGGGCGSKPGCEDCQQHRPLDSGWTGLKY